jgi:putative membrane protein
MLKTAITAAVLLTATLAASAQTPPPPPPTEAKTHAMAYVMAAGKSDLYEVISSQIALQKSRNPDVQKFAQMLIKHHQMTTAATMKAAQQAGLTPPPPSVGYGNDGVNCRVAERARFPLRPPLFGLAGAGSPGRA